MNQPLKMFQKTSRVFLFGFVITFFLGIALLLGSLSQNYMGYDGITYASLEKCMAVGLLENQCVGIESRSLNTESATFFMALIAVTISSISISLYAMSAMLIQTAKSIITGLSTTGE